MIIRQRFCCLARYREKHSDVAIHPMQFQNYYGVIPDLIGNLVKALVLFMFALQTFWIPALAGMT